MLLQKERLRSLMVRSLTGDAPCYQLFLKELSAHLRSCLRKRPGALTGGNRGSRAGASFGDPQSTSHVRRQAAADRVGARHRFVCSAPGVLLKGYGASEVAADTWPVMVFACLAACLAVASYRRRLN
jgi:hypothetical protein